MAKVLWGNPAVKSVICGNATASVVFDILIPIGIWLGLRIGLEQPGSSLLFQWPSNLGLIIMSKNWYTVSSIGVWITAWGDPTSLIHWNIINRHCLQYKRKIQNSHWIEAACHLWLRSVITTRWPFDWVCGGQYPGNRCLFVAPGKAFW